MKDYYVIFESVGKAVLKECEAKEPQAGEILIKNEFSAVSAGTERANLMQLPNTGSFRGGFPHMEGYSASGRVAALGEGVENFKIGDKVVVNWGGGHRLYSIKRADSVVKIEDDSIDMLDASFTHIASFSFLGVRKLKLEVGESAMIVGQGLLGVFALQVAILSGAIPVMVMDLDPVRRDLAMKLGASAAFSPDEENVIDKIKEFTGGDGPNAIVEVTGVAAALKQSLEYVARDGRISLLGCTRISDSPIDYYKYVHCRGISLIGAHTMTRPKLESEFGRWTEMDDYRAFLKFLAAKKIQVKPMISEVVTPDDAPRVYARLAENDKPPLGIAFDWRNMG